MHSARTNSHIMRRVTYFLHLFGFLSLPNHFDEPWKNDWHRYYSRLVVTLLQLYALSISIALFLYSIRDFAEFAEKFVESILCGTCTYGLFYLRGHLQLFMDLLDTIETFQFYHRRNPIVITVKRTQEKLMRLSYLGVGLTCFAANFIPLVPKSPSELDRIQKLYHLKHPENTLMAPLYIPFVDPSEPVTYCILYVFTIYIFFLLISAFSVSLIFFPFYAFDIKACADFSSEFVLLLGQTHRDAQGRRIFYTDIVKNEYIYRDSEHFDDVYQGNIEPKKDKEYVKALRYLFIQNPTMYEYYYFCQVVSIQKKLLLIRIHLNNFYTNLFYVISLLFLVMFMMSTYSCLLPAHTALIRFKSIVEAIFLVIAYFLYFICGEMIADSNPSLERAAWFSHWYKCSVKTRRGILMFLRSTKKIDYILIFQIFEIRYSLLVSTLRFSYSCFNLMNLRRSRLQASGVEK